MRQHRQRGVGFEIDDTAMDDGIGVGITGVNAERLRQPRAVTGLNRREAKPPIAIARGDEADQARAKYAHAVVEDKVIVRPGGHRNRSLCFSSLRGAKRRSNPFFPSTALWIASQSLIGRS